MMIVKSVLCVVALQNLQVSAFSTGDPTCCGVSIRGKESRHRIQAVLDGTGNGQKAARPSPPKDFAWKSIAISAVVIFAPLSISANAVSVQPSAVQSANALGGLEDSAQRAARQNVQLWLRRILQVYQPMKSSKAWQLRQVWPSS
jgi:hypothetical protein